MLEERLLVTTRNKLLIWDDGPHYIRDEWPYSSTYYAVTHFFYGATWDTETIYVTECLTRRRSVVHAFGQEFNWKGEVPLEKSPKTAHQILWRDEMLYITDPNTNRILLWDGSSTRVTRWHEEGKIIPSPNSIWCDGEKFYVVGHGGRTMPKWIGVLDLDFNFVEHIELPRSMFPENPRIHHGLHNVYIENGVLYTFSPTSVIRYELASKQSDHIDLTKFVDAVYYTRGLARVQGRFFIGLSEMKERKDRGEGGSLILVLDDDFNLVDVLTLELTGGLHEIRAIDSLDLAHNRVRCPLLKGEKYGKS